MTKNYLFPARFQKFGWMLLFPFGILFLYYCFSTVDYKFELKVPVQAIISNNGLLNDSILWFSITNNNIIDEITSIGLIVSLLLIAFSKEKDEDEYTSQIRANSLVWALLINFSFLILCELFVYDLLFLNILFLNLFFILILFVIKFKIACYKLRKSTKNEE